MYAPARASPLADGRFDFLIKECSLLDERATAHRETTELVKGVIHALVPSHVHRITFRGLLGLESLNMMQSCKKKKDVCMYCVECSNKSLEGHDSA